MADKGFDRQWAAAAAMQQALAAEQQARDCIAQARSEQQAQLEQARAQARRIQSRAPERIARLRLRAARAIEQAVSRIEIEEAGAMADLRQDALSPPLLRLALQRLAQRLTGADEEA